MAAAPQLHRPPAPAGAVPDSHEPTGASIVMVADVDLADPVGGRSHVLEIAAGFTRRGRPVELVTRGEDPQLDQVRHVAARPRGAGRAARVLAMNVAAARVVLRARSRSRSFYYRYDAGLVGVVVLASLLGYRMVGELNSVVSRDGDHDPGVPGRLVQRARLTAMALAARRTDHLVTVTDRLRTTLTEQYGTPASRVHALPNGVDLDRFRIWDRAEALRRTRLDETCRYVVFVGNLASWVDADTMVAGFAEAAASRPAARLLVVGDGSEAARWDELAAELGVTDRVVRLGSVVDRDLVAAYVGASTVCLVAYRAAALRRTGGLSPLKLTEYLASGRAVVGTAVEATSDRIGESGGGVVVPADPAAVGAALGRLLDDPDAADRLGLAGRRAAEERYSWSRVVARTLELLDGTPCAS